MMSEALSVHSSQADVWYLKQIFFGTGDAKRPVKIITQNFNGPCSFIAICNILVLRGRIEILPPDRSTVSYEFLSQLVAEYLLTSCPDIDISAALSIMPSTTKGLDLNPQFTSVTDFSPASDAGELALFAQAGIQLVHGWVVDPDTPESRVMAHVRDYDTAATLIADADYITHGELLGGGERDRWHDREDEHGHEHEHEAGPSDASVSSCPAPQYSDEDRLKIEHAIVAQQFLDATQSQLTYHGLFQLASTLEPGSLVALFRNAHLSVVYRSPCGPGPSAGAITPQPIPEPSTSGPADASASTDADTPVPASAPPVNPPSTPAFQDAALYALVTDDVFRHEQSIVWERLEDVDGGSSWFVDSEFRHAVPVGGDVAGQTAEAALRRLEVDPADQALARQIQAEEDARARESYARRREAHERRQVEVEEARRRKGSATRGRLKGKRCVVM